MFSASLYNHTNKFSAIQMVHSIADISENFFGTSGSKILSLFKNE